MKKIFTLILAIMVTVQISSAQQTAMDFTMDDCEGNMHNLYSILDGGNVVILEFFMLNCTPCITAGTQINAMKNGLDVAFPGKLNYFVFAFSNSNSCTDISDWVGSHGYNAVPFDSGATQVSYYGGFGMPTVVVVGGDQHQVLYSSVGYSNGDTADISDAIVGFLTGTGVNEYASVSNSIEVYPNPANEVVNVKLELTEPAEVLIELMNVSGEVIYPIHNGSEVSGSMIKSISTSGFAPGLYIIRATLNGVLVYSKMIIAK